MIFLDKIIAAINAHFLQILKQYPTAEYLGIATQTAIQRNSGTIIYPNVIHLDGTVQGTHFNAQTPYTVYHRLISTSLTSMNNRQYGQDGNVVLVSNTVVQLVMMGSRGQLNASPETLLFQLLDSLPANIDVESGFNIGIKSVKTMESSVEYDSYAIFNREFKGVKYFIGPELFMLAARYNISAPYMKGCASLCNC